MTGNTPSDIGESTDTQVVSDRATGLMLLAATLVAALGLQQLTGWNVSVWWRAGALLIGGYLVAATVLMGINQFAVRVWREYQRLT